MQKKEINPSWILKYSRKTLQKLKRTEKQNADLFYLLNSDADTLKKLARNNKIPENSYLKWLREFHVDLPGSKILQYEGKPEFETMFRKHMAKIRTEAFLQGFNQVKKEKASNGAYSFNKAGTVWYVNFDNESHAFKHSKGLDIIYFLIKHQGRSFSHLQIAQELHIYEKPDISRAENEEDDENDENKIDKYSENIFTQTGEFDEATDKKSIRDLNIRMAELSAIIKKSPTLAIRNEISYIKKYLNKTTFRGMPKKTDKMRKNAKDAIDGNIKRSRDLINRDFKAFGEHLFKYLKHSPELIYKPEPHLNWKT